MNSEFFLWNPWFGEGEAVDQEGESDVRDDDPQEDGAPLLPQTKWTNDLEDIVITFGDKNLLEELLLGVEIETKTHYLCYFWDPHRPSSPCPKR